LVRALHESGSSTPAIIFVGGFVDLTLPDAYDLGVEAVLSKPCPRRELVNALRRSMQRRNLVFDSDEDVPPPGAGDQIQQNFKTAPEGCPAAVGRGGISPTPAPPFNPGFSVFTGIRRRKTASREWFAGAK
jgi:DNA-binding NarL/FixJ family response regulator